MRILIFHHHRLLCIPNDAQQHALRQFQLCHRAQTLLVHACEQRIPREEGSFCVSLSPALLQLQYSYTRLHAAARSHRGNLTHLQLSDLSKEKSQMLWHDPL